MMGDFGGRGWEWIGYFFAFGGLWLLIKKIIRWQIPAGVFAGLLIPAGLMYIIGGYSGLNSENITTVVDVYDPFSNSWSNVASAPQPTRGATAVYLDGKIYVFGGWTGATILRGVQVFDTGS